MPCRVAVLAILMCSGACLRAEDGTARGERMLDAYFRQQTGQIADACLANVKSKDDWERQRPELRRQFLEMIGLWPAPPRIDLKATVTGKVDTEHFTVEKLHFQSFPGLYVTANLYVPKKAKFPAPTILYLCGHGNTVIDGISYGSKVNYQHHAAWFAEHGYVCLILDTLQLSEIPGIHHGTYGLTINGQKTHMWWWQTLGYTPAGVECWNAMRALDYLETRPESDRKRIGVTGRSGGGAYTWFLAAADDRPRCFVPVAGIADLWAHVVEGVAPKYQHGVISGHCDCMYMVNTYRWDFPEVAALAAPRPVLLGNSDVDDIFPVPSYRRLADKVRRIYGLYDAADHFQLLETSGPHKDTPELRRGAYAWMNRWLKDDRSEVSEPKRPRLTPQQLKVLDRVPEDADNARIHDLFIKPAQVEMPQVPAVAREWWPGQKHEWLQALRDKVFRGWPTRVPPLEPILAADVKHGGLRLRAFDFASDEAFNLRLWLLTAEKVEKPSLVVLTAVDETGFRDWLAEAGAAFPSAMPAPLAETGQGEANQPKLDAAKFEQNRRVLEKHPWAFATLAPRGIGPTRWAAADDVQVRRRFALLGQTLDGQRVWDVRRGLEMLRRVADLHGVPLWLQGKGDMAGIVLYAALFEPDVARLDLWHPPASHRQGPTFLNVLRVLDLPQALALAFPRPIRLYVKDDGEAKNWEWPQQLQKVLGQEYLKIRPVGN